MIKKTFYLFVVIGITITSAVSYGQENKKLTLLCEGGYQCWNNQTFFAGVGAKLDKPVQGKWLKTYSIHASLYFEKYLNTVNLKSNTALTSRISYEFKYISVGFYARNFNVWRNNESYRIDFAPEIGFGYKYLWVTYSTDILLYQQKQFPFSKDNLRISIAIPLFKLK